jgi:CRISPR-associated endonuclease/helicase Cas3
VLCANPHCGQPSGVTKVNPLISEGGRVGKLLAYTIAGHHGGMPDGLRGRIEKQIPQWQSYAPGELLAHNLEQSLPVTIDSEDAMFQVSFLCRMLFSALVDADFLATESFLNSRKHQQREKGAPLTELVNVLERHLDELSNGRTPVNRIRREILSYCVAASDWSPGLFSLTVPTGGGKTLASLMSQFGTRFDTAWNA